MTYIPSIYRSTPQLASISAGGTAAITAVNTAYTRLTIAGWESSDGSGNVNASEIAISFNSPTQLAAAGIGSARVIVEEFNPVFFRQAFQHGTITIGVGQTTGSVAHGLTLGPKAYAVFNGCTGNRTSSPGLSLSLKENQVRPTIFLSGASVFASVFAADYADGPGIVQCAYTLIDPV